MGNFWDAFWPNAASTIVGVILGLPVAMWINRLAIEHGERVRAQTDRRRVADALAVVSEAMKANGAILDSLVKVLEDDKALFELALDTSAWESVRSDISSEVDPDLRRRMAFHFARLDSLVKLNDLFLSFIVGTNASMSSAPETKKRLRPLLIGIATTQRSEATTLTELATGAAAQLQTTRP